MAEDAIKTNSDRGLLWMEKLPKNSQLLCLVPNVEEGTI